MPIPGAVGAIHAAARRRQGSGFPVSRPAKRSSGYPVIQESASRKASDSSTWETTSATSGDSMSSMFTKLKQQMQETGGYIKKKQQALAEKVQKGISERTQAVRAMSRAQIASDTSAQQQSEPGADPRVPEPVQPQHAEEKPETSRKAWVEALELMGFERTDIKEAIARLGGRARQIDDVVDLLVAKASREKASSSGASSSQTYPVTLKKGKNDRLGIQIDAGGLYLMIEEVHSKGLIAEWNASHPYLKVKAGDCILEVNGITGSPHTLVKEMMSSTSIRMSISSGESSQASPTASAVPEPDFVSAPSSGGASSSLDLTTPASGSALAAALSCEVVPAPVEIPKKASKEESEHENEDEGTVEAADNFGLVEEEDASGLASPKGPTTIVWVESSDLADEVSIPELASKVVHSAFVNASLEEPTYAEPVPTYAEPVPKKLSGEERSSTSPMRGGA